MKNSLKIVRGVVPAFARRALLFCLLTVLASGQLFANPVEKRVSININTASAEVIAETLNGVGLKKAQAIVDYRKQHGAFASVDALVAVKGVGENTLQKNRSRIRVR